MPRRHALAVVVLVALLCGCGGADRPAAAPAVPASSSPAAPTDVARAALSSPLSGSPTAGDRATPAASAPAGERPATLPPAGAVVTPSTPGASGTPNTGGTPRSGGQRRGGLECVAAVLQRHPIDLAPYDPATGRAGDARFVPRVMFSRIFTEFGFVIPAGQTSTGTAKANPQPTYLAPMGTPVYSAVDGVVEQIASLWSTPALGDVSVMVKPDGLVGGCYAVVELEHVTKPLVRAGDRVRAGQAVAEVGPLNSQGSSGLGMVEFGVLTGAGNGRPLHVCPYAYFALEVRDAQLGVLARLMADWEGFARDASLYDEQGWRDGVAGCRSGPIEE